MKHVFDLLATIREHPYMYVGGDSETDRLVLLRRLESLLDGYALAVNIHDSPEPVQNFVRGFSDWLRSRYKWDLSCRPAAAMEQYTKSPEEAWERFWTLVEEYRRDLGA